MKSFTTLIACFVCATLSTTCLAGSLADLDPVIQRLIHEKYPESELRSITTGDLNADGLEDIVAIAGRSCSESEASNGEERSSVECRRVFLILNTGNGKFEIAAVNDQLIDCSQCGGAGVGDPHQGVVIENGAIHFESLYGACHKTAVSKVFVYNKQNKNWYLEEIRTSDYDCNQEPENGEIVVSETVKTRKDFGEITFAKSAF
jgi:hypothetical protein